MATATANKHQKRKTTPKPPQGQTQAKPSELLTKARKTATNSKPTVKPARQQTPTSLWKGPTEEGITFSLLSKFLVCRERFRLKVVEGLVEDEGFNHKIEYGSMWHTMEEEYQRVEGLHERLKHANNSLDKYRTTLLAEHQGQQEEINKWAAICKNQFPVYLDYWAKHSDETSRKPVLEEVAFKVPYTLPSGRVVLLRGKWDAVFQSEITKAEFNAPATGKILKSMNLKPGSPILLLQENKTKGEIDEEGILKTVADNLQSMLYQTALRTAITPYPPLYALPSGTPIAGTLYNVIRRPLSDRFAIKQKKGREVKQKGKDGVGNPKPPKRVGSESLTQFLQRVNDGIKKNPSHYFMRWKVWITDEDMENFQTRMLNPILEQLCDWWEWIREEPFNPWSNREDKYPDGAVHGTWRNTRHYQTPWGIYNSMFGGFRGDYFDYLTAKSGPNGHRQGDLNRTTNLFPELE